MCGINHLVGVDFLDNNSNSNNHGTTDHLLLSNLSTEERDALIALRQRYNEYAPWNVMNGHEEEDVDVVSEEKKESSSSRSCHPLHPTKFDFCLEPKYEISNTDLPDSGWRPVDDFTLYRYLNADRNKQDYDGMTTFDIDASCQRLLEALQFRKDRNCDGIVHDVIRNTIPPDVQRCLTYKSGIYVGRDYHHRPVVFERLGQFLGSGYAHKCSEDEWITSYLYVLEMHFAQMRASSLDNKVPIQKIMYYADFAGIVTSIMNGQIWHAIGLMRKIVHTVERHYPEIVECITLFNVPLLMSSSFHVVRKFLDPVTAAKIGMYAGVPLEKFMEVISEDVIPVEYGGRNEMEFPHPV